jgi:thiamine pyrophosphate-dependent acetolactate synthase large subunit-like protein
MTLTRAAVIAGLLTEVETHSCFVSALGYISRDLYALGTSVRDRSFYCMGSMGSVIPLSLGIALGRSEARVNALEGDGSLLMNLGCLATVARYGPTNLRIILFDNRCYESTGQQASQPDSFNLESIGQAAGLRTYVADDEESLEESLAKTSVGPSLLVAKVRVGKSNERILEEPVCIAKRFSKWLQDLDV